MSDFSGELSSFLRKFRIAKEILEELTLREEYFSAGLVRKGKIIETTVAGKSPIHTPELASKIESVMTRGDRIREIPEEIIVRYSQTKVYFKYIGKIVGNEQIWLFAWMESNTLYFRRFIAKYLKQLKIIIFG